MRGAPAVAPVPVRAYLEAQQGRMLAMLEALVRAESPSLVPEAQQGVQTPLLQALSDLGWAAGLVPGQGGGHVYARPVRRSRGQPYQLLLGHSDTVWPLGTLESMPFVVDGNEVRGPGVFDMKGGLVQMVFALEALHMLKMEPDVLPVVFVNSDEEIGSRDARRHLERLARGACRAFVLEPALGLEGRLKTRRKGTGRFVVRVQGRSAHAGLAPEAGASAIVELSYVIQKLHALNDPARGVTVNVGRIDGGVRANVVAPVSTAVADVRVPSTREAARVARAIRGIRPTTPGTSLSIEGDFGRPPMVRTPRNAALWRAARAAAHTLGFTLAEGTAGGGSDGSFTSRHAATLDGMGAVGDGAHADHEFIYVDKMVERSALLALLLLLPASHTTRQPGAREASACEAAASAASAEAIGEVS